jgi:hypothetical protein
VSERSRIAPEPVLVDGLNERPPNARPWWRPVPYRWWDSGCVNNHSAALLCDGGCKMRPLAMAVVVAKPSWIERLLRWLLD